MMTRKIKLLFVLLVLVISAQRSFAQLNPIKQYTEDPIKFLEEVKTMFEVTTMDKKEIKEFMEEFTLVWNKPKYNANLKNATYTVCNIMVKKKIRVLPDYKNYLTSVMNFVNSNQSEANFSAWQGCIVKILGGSIKNYSEYLEMSENLFATNTFYKSSVVQYSSSNNNYQFEYEDVPKVIFPSLNLRIFNNQNDSGVVYNTKGVYYPDKGIFVGQGGKVNWKRTGLEDNMVWAELNRYEVILKTSGFTADSAAFYNKNYFQKSILGRVTEKVVSEKGSNISFPRFDSYNKRMQIPNIAKDVDYDGGFSMRGAKFLGSGDKEKDANLFFKRNGQKFLIVGAKLVGITAEKLTAENSNIKIYVDKDSIVHPNVNMKFMVKDRALSLIRTNSGISKSPFLNSYHKLEMYFEELFWKIDETMIDLRMLAGNTQEDGNFESSNYFRNYSYDALQGMDQTNPLIQIRNFVKQNGSRNFTGTEYAQYLKLSPRDVLPALVHLSGLGLVTYDAEDDEVYVNDKVFNYIDAHAAKIDYDVIRFSSVVRGKSNAIINLMNYDMSIFGVKQIFMSDSQNVTIFPSEQKIILKKNRDFVFEGVIRAGRFDLCGKEFLFEYDKFLLNLLNVDSVRIMVQSIQPNAYGEFPLVKIKTVIEKVNGSLEIDNPLNKSGRKQFSKYPIFNSFKDSYAYYDKKSIQNGKYPRDKFYFHLSPFTIDSLDNFSNAGLLFNGEFVSAGIFPIFKEMLRLQPDYSLGFINPSPANGYPTYGNKGVFTSDVKLSNQGLRGDGTLNYITSITKSKDFIFFPDSTNAIAQTFDVTEQKTDPEFPEVHGEEVKIHWMPYKDILNARNGQDKKISAFHKESEFTGLLNVTPTILTGNGTTDFNTAKLDAKLIRFKSRSFDSDTADFSLKSSEIATIAFATVNVNAHVDLDKRMGEFKSNGKGSVVKFPVNEYICFMESFKWYMDDESIEIGNSKVSAAETKRDLDLDGPEFISVHPKQDSLRFHAQSAKYDLKKFVISAQNVKFINVADAQIYPDSGNVYVDKNAVMRTFTNAKIVANTVTKYHNLYKCTVNAYGRKSYAGSGSYDYIDELSTKQTFYFSNISVDTTFQTYAETNIPETVKFMLSPNYDYKGRVKLKASNTFLVFDGAARISHDCPGLPKTWLKFESEIDPNLIYIPIAKDLYDVSDKSIAASLMIAKDSLSFYPAFLSPKIGGKYDISVLPASGYLFYDKTSTEYRISNKEKLIERTLPGNYLSLNTALCKIYGEGKIDLGGDLGQVKIESFGNATHLLMNDSTKFAMLMSLNFFFDDGAIEKMGEDILGNKDLLPVEAARPVYEKGLREMLGKEVADKLISQLNLYGSFKKLPDELRKTLVFSDIKMRWNKNTRSYTSIGKIGIANVNKTQINKYVDGQIEIIKKRTGDIINIYLELDLNNWYYFNYTREAMLAVSSNEAFNTIITELKSDKRKNAGVGGTPDFSYTICPPSKKTQFLRKTQAPVE